eukprot:6761378-Alexandrium_andersonii.AAC.1
MDAPAAGAIQSCSQRLPMGCDGLPPGEVVPMAVDEDGELERDLAAITDEGCHLEGSRASAGEAREGLPYGPGPQICVASNGPGRPDATD